MSYASLAQLAEHALRKRMVVGSIPTGGFLAARDWFGITHYPRATVRRTGGAMLRNAVSACPEMLP